MSVFQIIIDYKEAFAQGLFVTMQIAVLCWSLGIILGTFAAYCGYFHYKPINLFIKGAAFVLSSIPLLILLYWCHYPLQELLGVVINPFVTACLVLAAINIFGVADLIRQALDEFPSQYLDAAVVCGLDRKITMRKIMFPIILRTVFPALLLLQVQILQMTLFTSLISVNEVFRQAQRINSMIYRPIEIYSALAVFFILICAPLNGLAHWLRRKFQVNFSER